MGGGLTFRSDCSYVTNISLCNLARTDALLHLLSKQTQLTMTIFIKVSTIHGLKNQSFKTQVKSS